MTGKTKQAHNKFAFSLEAKRGKAACIKAAGRVARRLEVAAYG